MDTDAREAADPSAEGWRTWRVLAAQGEGQEPQDASDGTTAEAGLYKEVQGYPHPINLRQHGHGLRWALELAQTRRRLCEGWRGTVALGGETSELLALGSLAVAALRGLVLPLLSTVVDCGQWTHRPRSHPPP